MKAIAATIPAYHRTQSPGDRAICDLLQQEITTAMPKAESSIWHGSPVWFIDGNPVVGYHKLKDGIRLLFWSGQSFDEPGLSPEGTFKAAEVRYTSADEIKVTPLRRWLRKAKKIQWDYKNIVKRKGKLVRIET
ncbi:MAG: DUF1801 domain-containing protein [Bacteroidetes bacterium]|nr:DUF1801 domain-containing protein [Bacteroidota bacterium]